MQKVLAASFRDRPGFNTKSILLQSAITMCWLKQMAAMNATPGPVSVASWPQKRCFMWAEFFRLSALSPFLSKALPVHLSILYLYLSFVYCCYPFMYLTIYNGHMLHAQKDEL